MSIDFNRVTEILVGANLGVPIRNTTDAIAYLRETDSKVLRAGLEGVSSEGANFLIIQADALKRMSPTGDSTARRVRKFSSTSKGELEALALASVREYVTYQDVYQRLVTARELEEHDEEDLPVTLQMYNRSLADLLEIIDEHSDVLDLLVVSYERLERILERIGEAPSSDVISNVTGQTSDSVLQRTREMIGRLEASSERRDSRTIREYGPIAVLCLWVSGLASRYIEKAEAIAETNPEGAKVLLKYAITADAHILCWSGLEVSSFSDPTERDRYYLRMQNEALVNDIRIKDEMGRLMGATFDDVSGALLPSQVVENVHAPSSPIQFETRIHRVSGHTIIAVRRDPDLYFQFISDTHALQETFELMQSAGQAMVDERLDQAAPALVALEARLTRYERQRPQRTWLDSETTREITRIRDWLMRDELRQSHLALMRPDMLRVLANDYRRLARGSVQKGEHQDAVIFYTVAIARLEEAYQAYNDVLREESLITDSQERSLLAGLALTLAERHDGLQGEYETYVREMEGSLEGEERREFIGEVWVNRPPEEEAAVVDLDQKSRNDLRQISNDVGLGELLRGAPDELSPQQREYWFSEAVVTLEDLLDATVYYSPEYSELGGYLNARVRFRENETERIWNINDDCLDGMNFSSRAPEGGATRFSEHWIAEINERLNRLRSQVPLSGRRRVVFNDHVFDRDALSGEFVYRAPRTSGGGEGGGGSNVSREPLAVSRWGMDLAQEKIGWIPHLVRDDEGDVQDNVVPVSDRNNVFCDWKEILISCGRGDLIPTVQVICNLNDAQKLLDVLNRIAADSANVGWLHQEVRDIERCNDARAVSREPLAESQWSQFGNKNVVVGVQSSVAVRMAQVGLRVVR